MRRYKKAAKYTRHGMYGTPEYTAWIDMCYRCSDADGNTDYHLYGGRGIKVCDRWRRSFLDFLADMGPRPPKHTIDRIDNNGNYEPGNCRWATTHQQARNRRDNSRYTYQGRTLCLVEWAESTGIHPQTLARRLWRGWPFDKAITTPLRRTSLTRHGDPILSEQRPE